MRTSLFVALSCLLPLGCTVSRDGEQGLSQTIGSSGGQITVTASTDPALAGTQLVIPPGAVPDGTVITISQGAPQSVIGEAAVSPSVRLQPDGLVLAKPATLFVPYPGQPANSQLVVEVTSLGKKSEQHTILVSKAAGLAQFQIQHFSDWQIVARTCETPPQPDLSEPYPYPIDFAYHPSDLGGGSTDLAYPGYDFGSPGYDFGYPSYDIGYPSYDGGYPAYDLGPSPDDGGSSFDLAPAPEDGYIAPAICGEPDSPPDENTPVDLAIQPKG